MPPTDNFNEISFWTLNRARALLPSPQVMQEMTRMITDEIAIASQDLIADRIISKMRQDNTLLVGAMSGIKDMIQEAILHAFG